MKKNLRITLITITVIIGIAFCFIYWLTHRALPNYNEDIEIAGLSEPVKVIRDDNGVPHIYAENEADLYKAVGYITAQDRFWQMDLLRRVTMGRISEVIGDKALKVDLLMRSLRLTQKSKEIIANTPPEMLAAVEAYAAGVNQYIEDNKDNLPQEFAILGYEPEPWEVEHSFNLIGYMAWDLTPNYKAEIILEKVRQKCGNKTFEEFIPQIDNYPTVIYPEFKLDSATLSSFDVLGQYESIIQELGLNVFTGSNNWAVAGKKSSSGNALLCNDMHLKFSIPGIWYQVHQVVEGRVNVTGVMLPGQPLVVSGHNENMAWGMTNVAVDNVDFYREKATGNEYQFNGAAKSMRIEKHSIGIKGEEAIEKEIRYTHRGPVISDWVETGSNDAISMRWTGSEIESNEFRTIYLLNRANNWEDFKDAAKTFAATSQNIVFADAEGNIGLYCCAGVPIRKKGTGYFVASGETDEYDWNGYVPFEQLPHEYNPERGYVSSANNKTAGDYPYHIGHWFAPPHRIDRIREMLAAEEKHTVNSMAEIQTDFKSKLAEKMVPEILNVLNDERFVWEGTKKEAINALSNWDYVLNKESKEALVFESFLVNFMKQVIGDELGDSLYIEFTGNNTLTMGMLDIVWNNQQSPLHNHITTDKTETFSGNIAAAYHTTIDNLIEQYGENSNEWQWGNAHQLVVKHPLGGAVKALDVAFGYNTTAHPIGGSYHTVAPFSYTFSDRENISHGASQRHIYEANNWDNSITVIPCGNSGNTASEYYKNQLQLYINGEYHPDNYSSEKVTKSKAYEMKFVPK